MRKTTPLGIICLGWFSIIIGSFYFFIFLRETILISNEPLFTKFFIKRMPFLTSDLVLELRNSLLVDWVRYPLLYVNNKIIVPVLWLFVIIGGKGILRFKNKYRKILLFFLPVTFFFSFISQIYYKTFPVKLILSGILTDDNLAKNSVYLKIDGIMSEFINSIFRDLFFSIIILSLIMLYLNRNETKKYFTA